MERSKRVAIAVAAAGAMALVVVGIGCGRNDEPRTADPTSAAAPEGTSAQADEEAALKAAEPVQPEMIGYHEAGTFAVALKQPTALAVDGNGQIYVGGDRAIVRYSDEGKKLAEITLEAEPKCLTIGVLDHLKPGEIYVGMEDHVEIYEPQGTRVAVWPSPRRGAFFTSIATTEHQVWVADAGNRLVWRYSLDGRPLRTVGESDSADQPGKFVVTDPHHYFDLAAGTDDLVYVVNPRLLHVEGFTQNGEYEIAWGKGSPAVADFFGCCNPAQLAVLPDGRFVTGEKGIPRVKIYARTGTFETVVAGPSQLNDTPTDLAADPRGRVLVLDGRAAKVRVFEKDSSGKEEKEGAERK